MPKLKYFKNSSPEIEEKLNKYRQSYTNYLEILVRVHNYHYGFLKFPHRTTGVKLKNDLILLKRTANALYLEVLEIQKMTAKRRKERLAENRVKRDITKARRAQEAKRKANGMDVQGSDSK